MYGIDISSYQNGIDLLADNCEFVIMKATEGTGLKDKCLDGFVKQVENTGKLCGLYHFARPDLNKGIDGMRSEAMYFYNTIKELPIYDRSILVLDWEIAPFDRQDLIEEWLKCVESLTEVKPFVYGSASKLKQKGFSDVIKNYPLWVAAWPSKEEIPHCQPIIPGTMATRNTFNWSIWQFSANGRGFGIKGPIDCDYTDMTPNEWKSHTRMGSSYGEQISEEMRWCIDNGIVQGRDDGFIYPNDFATRDDVAKMIYRYHQKFGN